MPAVLFMAGEDGPPAGIGIIVAAVVALIVILALTVSVRERRHLTRLLEYVAREDWQPVPDPTGLPPIVAEALVSKRSKLFRRFRTMPLWVSWHQWKEVARDESRTGSTTRDVTRYFALLPGTVPDMVVERRRRPDPKGAGAFERRFLVKAGGEVAAPVPPRVAQALLAETVPTFTISGNVLIVRFDDRPTTADLSTRADAVRRLMLLLTPSRQNRG